MAPRKEAKKSEATRVQNDCSSRNSRSNSNNKSSTHSKDCQAPCPELPDVITLSILACVPLKQRLAVCARVNKAWKAAAVAATKDISLQKHPKDGVSFDRWLVARGHKLTSLQLAQRGCWYEQDSTHCSFLSLPCASLSCLQSLTVEGYMLQLCSTVKRSTRSTPAAGNLISGSYSPPGPLPVLKQLTLQNAMMALGTLRALFSLRGLTCLSMSDCRVNTVSGPSRGVNQEDWADEMAGWLKQLTNLRSLTLHRIVGPMYPTVVDALSALTQLQHLHLDQDFDDFYDGDVEGRVGCPHLANSLTSLVFVGACAKVSPSTAPGFSRLTALQRLSLSKGAQLGPSMLASVPQLRIFELDFCNLLRPQGPPAAGRVYTFEQSGTGSFSEPTTEFTDACVAVAAFFTQLLSLTQLESLTLSNIWGLKVQPLQSFEALTASSHLTALRLQAQEASFRVTEFRQKVISLATTSTCLCALVHCSTCSQQASSCHSCSCCALRTRGQPASGGLAWRSRKISSTPHPSK